jgi:hypothetical protein
MEYESVTQKVLLLIESMQQNAKQLQHAHLSWHVSGLKIIGHRNIYNNVESHCTYSVHEKRTIKIRT